MASPRPSTSVVLSCLLVWLGACSRDAPDGETHEAPSAVSAAPADTAAPLEMEPSTLASDETVMFLPTYAVQRDGAWQIPIDAWVFEPEENAPGRRVLLKLLGEGIELAPGSPDADVVANNLRAFVVDNERGERVAVHRGAHGVQVGPTGSDGRANATLAIPVGDPAARGEGTPPWVELSVVMPRGDGRSLLAWAQLVADEGVSVISDIDDTIKITEVLDKKKLLENTFLRPPRAVPGMADTYRRWAEQGVAFHYVSASPLPLLGALSAFTRGAGFPRGSLSLRPFRWIDGTAIDLLEPSEAYKREVIAALFESFEQRRFVLVGDTGERDPEIYADVAKEHPEQVTAVYLRDPTPGGTAGLSERLDAVFEGVPRSRWHVITDGAGLPASL